MTNRSFYNGIAGIIVAMFMLLLPILANAQDEPVPVPENVKKTLERLAIKYERNNYFFFATESIDRTVVSTWLTDKEQASAQSRIDALRETWDIVQAPNFENFAVYSTQALAGNKELGLYPIGKKTSFSSAEALMAELERNPMITDEFNLEIAHANAFGGAIPINHGVITMYPKDDEGPGFLVDRYINRGFAIIEEQYTLTYVNPLLRVFTGTMPSDHFRLETIDDPDLLLNSWEEIITPAPDVNCLLPVDDEGVSGASCSSDSNHLIVLGGLMSDIEAAKDAVDAEVFSVEDGIPCGNSMSKTYKVNRCNSSLGECNTILDDMGCSEAASLGIDYLSRCVWNSDATELTTYIIAYQKDDTGLTCLDY